MKKVLIIIPAYNEAKNIERVVDNLVNNFPQYDYVIVNDGSSDNTASICEKRRYSYLNLPINLGLSGAFQAGVKYAYEMGYDMALQLDGDGQHKPEYLERMIQKMEKENIDIVIGSRFCEKKSERTSLRTVGGNIISLCIKFTTGTKITDPTSGMRLYNRKVLKEFAYVMNYTPEPDTISFLIRTGIKVKEVQVEMDERIEGESYLNTVNAIKYMLHMCVSILFVQRFRARRK